MSSNSASTVTGGGGGSGGCGGGGGGSGGGGGPCGACKFLRRKCVAGCIFAPYFDSEQGATHFAAVHKVFGASNVSKLLLNIPVHKRLDAVVTICFEAQARLRDPVYGCVANIFALQQQVVNLQAELSYLQGHLATLQLPQPPPPPPPPLPQAIPTPTTLSIANISTGMTSSLPATYDLSSLFDPIVQTSWALPQRPMDLSQYGPGSSSSGGSGGGDLHALARELLNRHGSPPSSSPMACSKASSSSPSLSK
ncbi:LOB domain-containing protein 18-like [Prosopis cineraria]|uniref:LOB domain-containing protein 18-like n=1 Tax=Prosopis cineraria TaxID=364024 RepID=UPI0024108A65|nr:LOB domain-containing protein 18-like [Prosopis cineraria]